MKLKELLSNDERIYFETKPDWFVYCFWNVLFTILLSFTGTIIFLGNVLGFLGLFLVFCGIGILIYKQLEWKNIIYGVTTKRIIKQSGIIGKDYVDCPLNAIQNMYVNYSVFERIFGVGTISFSTSVDMV